MNNLTTETQKTERYIQIDEDGDFSSEGAKITDAEAGHRLLKSVFLDERGRAKCRVDGVEVWIEAFDEPYIARTVHKSDSGPWVIQMPYEYTEPFRFESLSLDEADRFHGRTERGIPFVLSRSAQAEFFNLVDDFDDDSITVAGKKYDIGPWLKQTPAVSDSKFWNDLYCSEKAGWELNQPHGVLPAFVPKLKLSRSRVLVLGAGSGNDAAWFAQQGHIVTAVDFSHEAIARAKQKYGHLENLRFVQADVLQLPHSMDGQFDLVVEHTCYCAIDPTQRNELVRAWRRCLSDSGRLLGIFFVFEKREGPPFGGSEWEVRERLKKGFRPLYWFRWRQSGPARLGTELVVFAEKRQLN
jgi:SAM-dependent methyltransferase